MRRDEIIGALQGAYGTDPTFRIRIRIKSLRTVSGRVFLVFYEELEIEEGQQRQRLSSAVLTGVVESCVYTTRRNKSKCAMISRSV
jgi:hypothetical protein